MPTIPSTIWHFKKFRIMARYIAMPLCQKKGRATTGHAWSICGRRVSLNQAYFSEPQQSQTQQSFEQSLISRGRPGDQKNEQIMRHRIIISLLGRQRPLNLWPIVLVFQKIRRALKDAKPLSVSCCSSVTPHFHFGPLGTKIAPG